MKLSDYQDYKEAMKLCFTNTKITKNSIKINEIRYLGAFGDVDEKWIQELELSRTSRSYKRTVKDSCLYATCLKVNDRSDNSFAMLSDKRYAHLYKFISDLQKNKEFIICKIIETSDALENMSKYKPNYKYHR